MCNQTGPIRVIIIGDRDADDLREMRKAAWSWAREKSITVELLSADDSDQFPPGDDGAAKAYLCYDSRCIAFDSPSALTSHSAASV